MFVIHLTDLANSLHRLLITNMTAQRVTRIRWISDQSSFSNNFHSTTNQALLRCYRVNYEVLAHENLPTIIQDLMRLLRLLLAAFRLFVAILQSVITLILVNLSCFFTSNPTIIYLLCYMLS